MTSATNSTTTDAAGPLEMWNKSVEDLTSVKQEDIRTVYRSLVEAVNNDCYDRKLFNDPSLFP